MSKILIFGGGHVSKGVRRALANTNHEVHCITSETLDYNNMNDVRKHIVDIRPDTIINTVAFTDVVGAEMQSKKEKCQALNVIFPVVSSIWAKAIHAEYIHFSTNYVFDGKAKEPYTEDALTNPLNYYGITKDRADQILGFCERTKIFRLASVYSNSGYSFVSQLKDKFMDIHNGIGGLPSWHNAIEVVEDQLVQPSHADWIGEVVVKCLDKPYYGMYNLVPDGQCSYADFAEHILNSTDQRYAKTKIQRISSEVYRHQQVTRPKYGIMDNSHIKNSFKLTFPTWQEVYNQYTN